MEDADGTASKMESSMLVVGSRRGASSTQSSTRQHGHHSKNAAAYLDAMTIMVSSIKRMAEAMERKIELEERGAAIYPSVLLQTLQKIEGLSQDDVALVFEGLLADNVKLRAYGIHDIST